MMRGFKQILKQLGIVTLVVVLGVCSTLTSYGAISFPDVPAGAWYEDHVTAVADAGIIVGNAKGEFMPNEALGVDQFIKTMVVALGYELTNGDVYWASNYMDKAREIGIIDESEFTYQAISAAPITRAQMAKICDKTVVLLVGDMYYIM
jgi:hypothetical protein